MTKPEETPAATPPKPPYVPPATAHHATKSSVALLSMILGIISLLGPGLLLGIPAIVMAIIALKRNERDRGFSITGLVTGIISTVVSLLIFLALLFFAFALSNAGGSSPIDTPTDAQPSQTEDLFDSSET